MDVHKDCKDEGLPQEEEGEGEGDDQEEEEETDEEEEGEGDEDEEETDEEEEGEGDEDEEETDEDEEETDEEEEGKGEDEGHEEEDDEDEDDETDKEYHGEGEGEGEGEAAGYDQEFDQGVDYEDEKVAKEEGEYCAQIMEAMAAAAGQAEADRRAYYRPSGCIPKVSQSGLHPAPTHKYRGMGGIGRGMLPNRDPVTTTYRTQLKLDPNPTLQGAIRQKNDSETGLIESAVVRIFGIPRNMFCDHIFNLLCQYCDVKMIKFLFRQRNAALVLTGSPEEAQGLLNLDGLMLQMPNGNSTKLELTLSSLNNFDTEFQNVKAYNLNALGLPQEPSFKKYCLTGEYATWSRQRRLKLPKPPSAHVAFVSQLATFMKICDDKKLMPQSSGMMPSETTMGWAEFKSTAEAGTAIALLNNTKVKDKGDPIGDSMLVSFG